MYGETSPSPPSRPPSSGLSPHVRGNRLIHPGRDLQSRSIPACTGKPFAHEVAGSRARVYPRMYGETNHQPDTASDPYGLSPHVRGNQPEPVPVAEESRSIPACTGKPWLPPATFLSLGVYPRMYGETSTFALSDDRALGLSPHVRGNLAQVEVRRH